MSGILSRHTGDTVRHNDCQRDGVPGSHNPRVERGIERRQAYMGQGRDEGAVIYDQCVHNLGISLLPNSTQCTMYSLRKVLLTKLFSLPTCLHLPPQNP